MDRPAASPRRAAAAGREHPGPGHRLATPLGGRLRRVRAWCCSADCCSPASSPPGAGRHAPWLRRLGSAKEAASNPGQSSLTDDAHRQRNSARDAPVWQRRYGNDAMPPAWQTTEEDPMLRLPHLLTRQLPRFLETVGRIPPARTAISWVVINQLANSTSPRPRALSMLADYTSWESLTNRKFSGRHLAPGAVLTLPTEADVVQLYRRGGDTVPSADTSVMFMFFAQWFTDSFLRTSRTDFRQNTSNHEIDLCQIYGLSEDKTRILRADSGGKVKSQLIDGEEYPTFLFQPRAPGTRPVFKPEFAGLHDESFIVDTILGGASETQQDLFFAVGLEHGNSTVGSTIPVSY